MPEIWQWAFVQKGNPNTELTNRCSGTNRNLLLRWSEKKHCKFSLIRKTTFWTLKEQDQSYCSQHKADQKRSRILFNDIPWDDPCTVEYSPPKNIQLILKNGTNISQVVHHIRLQPCPQLENLCQIYQQHRWTSNREIGWSSNLMVSAIESEKVWALKTFADQYQDEPNPPNSPKKAVRFDRTNDSTSSIPGNILEGCKTLFSRKTVNN